MFSSIQHDYHEDGYTFSFRSNGVVVLKGDEYIGFFDTIDQAFEQVLGG